LKINQNLEGGKRKEEKSLLIKSSVYLPCPTPIYPIKDTNLCESKTSLTIPLALHWYNRPLGPQVTIPAAS